MMIVICDENKLQKRGDDAAGGFLFVVQHPRG